MVVVSFWWIQLCCYSLLKLNKKQPRFFSVCFFLVRITFALLLLLLLLSRIMNMSLFEATYVFFIYLFIYKAAEEAATSHLSSKIFIISSSSPSSKAYVFFFAKAMLCVRFRSHFAFSQICLVQLLACYCYVLLCFGLFCFILFLPSAACSSHTITFFGGKNNSDR